MVWICLKDVHVLLGEIQKTCFLRRRRLSSYFNLKFIYEQWLVITASWEDLATVVFVSSKFMSSCVICIVIAREIFLLQSDCSAITWKSVFTADFSRIIRALLFCETSSPLLPLVWVARTKLNSEKSLESFLSLLSIFGYLGKETNNIVLGQAPAICVFGKIQLVVY